MNNYQTDYNKKQSYISCQETSSFYEGLAAIKQNKKWGFINKKGEIAIPCIYDSWSGFEEGLVSVAKNGKWGYIDKVGREVTPFIYSFADDFCEGIAVVYTENTDGSESVFCINKEKEKLFVDKYSDIENFNSGRALIENANGLYGYIDITGELVIPATIEYAHSFSKGYALVSFKEKEAVIDTDGNKIIDWSYGDYHDENLSEGILVFRQKDIWKIFHCDTRETISLETLDIIDIQGFSDGVCILKDSNKKYGIIDKKGKMIIPCIYESLNIGEGGLISARKNKKWGVINHDNSTIIPFEYSEARVHSDGLTLVYKGNKAYFLDKNGNVSLQLKTQNKGLAILFILAIVAIFIVVMLVK